MRISDWSSDVCSSDLNRAGVLDALARAGALPAHFPFLQQRPPGAGGGFMTDARSEGMGGGRVAADELRLLIERADRLDEEKKGITDDIPDVLAQAKTRGYDARALNKSMPCSNTKKEAEQWETGILEHDMIAMGIE